MQGDPQRPYAQLLAPAAKSQKLLLRLQHNKLSNPEQVLRAQQVFRVWQALLQKNIPSTPWPSFADLVMFLDGHYLPVLIAPFHQLEAVREAYEARVVDGYLLLSDREDNLLSVTGAGEALISMQLLERMGRSAWMTAAHPLTAWQATLVQSVEPRETDAALDLLRLLGSETTKPWHGSPPGVPEAVLAEVYFRLRRAQGGCITVGRLGTHPQTLQAADYLAANVPGVKHEGVLYSFRSDG